MESSCVAVVHICVGFEIVWSYWFLARDMFHPSAHSYLHAYARTGWRWASCFLHYIALDHVCPCFWHILCYPCVPTLPWHIPPSPQASCAYVLVSTESQYHWSIDCFSGGQRCIYQHDDAVSLTRCLILGSHYGIMSWVWFTNSLFELVSSTAESCKFVNTNMFCTCEFG